jgi:hypothetical protein
MGTPSKNVGTRADGRPSEERHSENPEEQAEAILEDSEERLERGAEGSIRKENLIDHPVDG